MCAMRRKMYKAFRAVFARGVASLRPQSLFALEDNIVALENTRDKNVAPEAESKFESDIDEIRRVQFVLRLPNAMVQSDRRYRREGTGAQKSRQMCRSDKRARHICRTAIKSAESVRGLREP